MGLLQKACETYDAHQAFAGVPRAEHQTLVPVSHMITCLLYTSDAADEL